MRGAVPPAAPRSAVTLVRAYAAGETDPVAVAEAALERARSPAGEAVFTRLTAERALREAQASAARHRAGRPLGPLDGVPIAWKDLFDVRGTVTTAGSAALRDAPPASADGPLVARLAQAGAVCIGKTNLSELAFSGLGINAAFGTPRHPSADDPERLPGGSSSGAAVAVAIGAAVCAIGTDTSGSVRVPAALTGLVGFRPTSARHERAGVLALAPTLDSVGPIAGSVADAVVLDAALRGTAPAPARVPADARPALVAPVGELTEDLDDPTTAAFAAALERLDANGWTVERRPLPALDAALAALDAHGTVVAAEAAWEHRELLRSPRAALLDPRTRARLEVGETMRATEYVALLRARATLGPALAAQLAGAAAIFPTARIRAPRRGPLERDPERYAAVNLRLLRSTMVASLLDMPGVALPTGADAERVPTSVLVSLPAGEDERLLALAGALERSLA